MKLTSISKHSDLIEETRILDKIDKWNLHRKRIEFSKQSLNVSMFVPAKLVNGKWVVLDKPETCYLNEIECLEYETALSNLLFEDCSCDEKYRILTINCKTITLEYLKSLTIEDIVELEPILTATAKKQLGL